MTTQLTAEQAEKYMEENPGAVLIDKQGDYWISPPCRTSATCLWDQGMFYNASGGSKYAPFTLPPQPTVSPDTGIPVSVETPTLRDQFAMAAFGGLISYCGTTAIDPMKIAEKAYKLADAMMKARGGQND